MTNPFESLVDLKARSDTRLHALTDLIEANGLEEASLGDAYLNRRGADILAHLHAWHLLFEDWLHAEAAGGEIVMPAPGYTWEDLRTLNDDLYERYSAFAYGEIKDLVLASHDRLFELLDPLSFESLTDPAVHPWSSQPLLELAAECSGNHYDWGIERVEAAVAQPA
ncbi:MAG: ClbS/DfsB family four-helix bundle protein [Demequinaceae bacterium]|nr:ClbS/DfsB family four-helix bundle protein [Demequinaceae bacterium]